ncbi:MULTISPECIES: TetR family transcriptional regulator [Burkholderia cepacia complex]|uniref:TetR family transcriptional regulator n=1 Tax=Burkholderia cenocepacia TaxID=95486 RepID=A0A3R9D1W9_9BURK|nr:MULTISPECIES: TetR family transcriptional regulator [Burkholderia cepacia complex]AQQ25857.1 TetR family transcriptional regulator [Burkholderia cenocepacia]AQQ36354.1 TetR family transcriptional regulator [Burkholderia cenocepacia]AQT53791.1 TetR family transcriptional regulator [Burkholderia cenocepacia]MBR7995561.1 TetR family transcriptional regulator [Burkholderia cenocepacia]MBR8078693.1 TetR family transcriptional regulator [Burkholderia cenocepacia]
MTNYSGFTIRIGKPLMTDRRNAPIATRKQPRQARSTRLVEDVLQAAIQVLASEGAQRFTMARVAERAGVSVGSLYQYFPNKASVLFRLQHDEWRQTHDMLCAILQDTRKTPPERLRTAVHAFIRSECDEAPMRIALDDAAPLYRDAPEAQDVKAEGNRAFSAFMREALPDVSDATHALACELILTTLTTGGKAFSETARTPAEIDAYSAAMADMFCAYLAHLAHD